MSHFARPQNSRRVQEKARIGRPFGFTSWSNEENGDREKWRKEEYEKTRAVCAEKDQPPGK